jgi:hypothetical protein
MTAKLHNYYYECRGGISPVIGVILILAVTVALVSLATFVVFDISDETNETPHATITLSDEHIRLIRLGNADTIIVREGGLPDYELNVGEEYIITGEYDVKILGVIDGTETLIRRSGGKQISTRHNKRAENVQEIFDNLDGDGTEGNPYIITNDQELQAINKDITGHYRLGNNIDAIGTRNWYNGDGFKPIPKFEGSLDGYRYEIVGLTINRPTETNVGLIAESEGTLENIGFVKTDVTGDENVGSIIGRNSNHVLITNSYSLGSVKGNVNVGGVVGLNHNHAEIRESYSIYTINGTDNVGGIIGKNNNHAQIYDSYSNGTINGVNYVGGIIGNNNNHGDIHTSYAVGEINGYTNTGGLIGNINGDITNSYWDINSTGQTQRDLDEGTGLKTSEMTGDNAEINMIGFDFNDIWYTDSDSRPYLQWKRDA